MDVHWVDAVVSISLGIGLAAAAGFRVFLPLLVLGIAARSGQVSLVSSFAWLASTPGIAALAIASLAEIAGYFVPIVDNLLDAAAGPLAILAGVLLTAAVATELPAEVRWSAAIIAGGGTAGVVQALTSIARLKSTVLTAGIANPVLATIELIGSLVTAVVAIALPLLAVVIAVGVVLVVRRLARRLLSRGIAPATAQRRGYQGGSVRDRNSVR
jgi:hypothetical protein